MLPHAGMKLGKLPARFDSRTLRLESYIGGLPPAPASVTWSSKVPSWPMYLNDSIGDCAIATPGHLIQSYSFNAGQPKTPLDADVLAMYERFGYVPGDPTTDNGCVLLDVMKSWRQDGLGGDKIGAFASINPRNLPHVSTGIWLFGGVATGFALPASAQDQDVWDVVEGDDGAPGSWGGHAVPIVDYDDEGNFTCVTWGALKKLTRAFLAKYCDEMYAAIDEDFLPGGAAPNGFASTVLQADLALVSA